MTCHTQAIHSVSDLFSHHRQARLVTYTTPVAVRTYIHIRTFTVYYCAIVSDVLLRNYCIFAGVCVCTCNSSSARSA